MTAGKGTTGVIDKDAGGTRDKCLTDLTFLVAKEKGETEETIVR